MANSHCSVSLLCAGSFPAGTGNDYSDRSDGPIEWLQWPLLRKPKHMSQIFCLIFFNCLPVIMTILCVHQINLPGIIVPVN